MADEKKRPEGWSSGRVREAADGLAKRDPDAQQRLREAADAAARAKRDLTTNKEKGE